MRGRHLVLLLVLGVLAIPAEAREYTRSYEALLEQADAAVEDERWADARDLLQKASVLAPRGSTLLDGIREIVEDKCTTEATRLALEAKQSLLAGENELADWSCRQAIRHASSRHPARAQCTDMLSALVMEKAYRELSKDNLRTARQILKTVKDPNAEAQSLLNEVDDQCFSIASTYLLDARGAWIENNKIAACTYCRLGLSFASERQDPDDIHFCKEVRAQCK